jgi:adenylate cyclase
VAEEGLSAEALQAIISRQRRDLETLAAVSVQINSTLELEPLFEIVLAALDGALGFEYSMIFLASPEAKGLELRAARGYEDAQIGVPVRLGLGPIGISAKRRRVLRMANIKQRRRYMATANRARSTGQITQLPGLPEADAQIVIPLVVKDRLVGALSVESTRADAYDALDERLVSIIANLTASALENAQAYERQRALTVAYERFVPKEFLDFLEREHITAVQLGDQVALEMSILFSDIRSFTTLSEQMTPKENFDFLNDYLRAVAPAIKKNHGFIDKYIGDAIMALFAGSADHAVNAASEMRSRLEHFNSGRMAAGDQPIAIGVGLHTGRLMLGTIGHHDRMETTVIADSVNLAARVEGLTKRYGASVLLTEFTRNGLSDLARPDVRFVDRVRVKGKTDPVEVYELRTPHPNDTAFALAIEHYYARRWAEAERAFHAISEETPADFVANLFLERTRTHRAHPVAEDWDGVETLDQK